MSIDTDALTEDELLQAQLEEDQAGFALAEAYANDLPDDVILKLAKSSKSAADFGQKLGEAKSEIEIAKTVETVTAAADKRFEELSEEYGLNDRPRYTSKSEPEEEEEPFGNWTASEGDSWPVIAEKFNSGAMSLTDYEREREARGMEALH